LCCHVGGRRIPNAALNCLPMLVGNIGLSP
jgi:hypothetical protein